MNKSILGVFGVMILVALSLSLLASIVFAAEDKGRSIVAYDESANDNSNEMLISTKNETATAKNMTYGQCVSEVADLKNTCYDTVKEVRNNCTTNADGDKSKVKQCDSNYKQDKNQCKLDFKEAKKTCTQYKKTFWDKVRFWM